MKVVFLFGEICSGKSTYDTGQQSAKVTVSNVVRKLIQSEDREVLQNTAHLDKVIADELIESIFNIYHHCEGPLDTIVIDGIRQYSILAQMEQFLAHALPTTPIEYKWLEVDRDERKRRFEARKDPKDTLTFEEAEKRDNALGLSDLFRILKEQNKI